MNAIRATLEALSEYISWKERHDAASQLPQGIKNFLRKSHRIPVKQGSEDNLSPVDEFIQYVSILEDKKPEVARIHAQAVLSVFREAISDGEFEDIRAQLPAEIYNEFLAEKK